MKLIKTISVRKFKLGYHAKKEVWEHGGSEAVELTSAYTPEGHYIGRPKDAHRLITKYGVKPELASPTNTVCTVGYSSRRRKWYGWSHRAIFGFGIGSTVKATDCIGSDRSDLIGFTAKTKADARMLAVAYAESVS